MSRASLAPMVVFLVHIGVPRNQVERRSAGNGTCPVKSVVTNRFLTMCMTMKKEINLHRIQASNDRHMGVSSSLSLDMLNFHVVWLFKRGSLSL